MKIALFVIGILAAFATGVGGVLALISLAKQANEADRPSTVEDVAQIRKVVLGVDAKVKWVAWLTLLNAFLSLILAFSVLQS
ncbi:hypothetical protein [Streptomyces sp. NPDC060198]|uniref:hypothetical protein n=1 Tax=Streptomyces sp. NPDC060198 TaxID=3347070 RepID=UPI00366019F2